VLKRTSPRRLILQLSTTGYSYAYRVYLQVHGLLLTHSTILSLHQHSMAVGTVQVSIVNGHGPGRTTPCSSQLAARGAIHLSTSCKYCGMEH